MKKKDKDKERGGINLPTLSFFFIIFILALFSVSAVLKALTTQKAAIQARAESTLKDAIIESINSPLTQAGDIDPSLMQFTILQVFEQKMNLKNGSIIPNTFIVYSEADAGRPAPVEIGGTIPGRSVYMDLIVTWTTPKILGHEYTGTYHVRQLVALPIYFAPSKQWN